MRNPTIDIAKGIGIALVVAGHNHQLIPVDSEAFRVVFSFHVPLFLFLSGVFFKPQAGLVDLVRQRSGALLKPFFAVALAQLAISMAMSGRFSPVAIAGIGYANGHTLNWSAMWFLPHLFLVFCGAWLLLNAPPLRWLSARFGARPVGATLVALLLPAGVAVISAFMQPDAPAGAFFGHAVGLPFSADLLPISIGFFLAGHVAARAVLDFRFNAAGAIGCAAMFATLHLLFNESLDLNLREYGNFTIATLEAFSGIYLALAASALLARSALLTRALSAVGAASLFVLIFHAPIQGAAVFQLAKHTHLPAFVTGTLALLIALIGSVLIAEAAKRLRWFGWLMLPRPAVRRAAVGLAGTVAERAA